MARKTTVRPAEQVGPDFSSATPEPVAQVETGMNLALRETEANAQALAVRLGYEGSLTVGSLEDEIRFFQRRTVEACLELGKRLLLLKELTPHGEFRQRVELLNLDYTMAKRFMAATAKFANGASTHLLAAAGTQTKLLELVVLDDGEIEALEQGESARGITLDEIDTMSVRELRAALREAKAESADRDKVIAAKEAKITEQDKRIAKLQRRVETAPPDEVLAEIRRELLGHAVAVEGAIVNSLRPAFQALSDHIAAHGGASDEYLDGCLGQIERAVRELREEFGLTAAQTAQWAGQ